MSSSKHILHVTPYYPPAYAFGGVVRAVEGMTRALVRRGHRVTVLTTDSLSLEERYHGAMEAMLDGVRVVRVPNLIYQLRRFNLSTPLKMSRQAQRFLAEIDAIHLHEFRTVENLMIAPLAKKVHKPVILSPHGTLNLTTGRSLLKMGWDRLLSPGIAKHIDHVLALAQSELDDIQQIWPNFGNLDTQFSIIPNGIDPAEIAILPDATPFREKYGLQHARIVLFMGRLHERKGVEPLARAFLQANIPDTKLILAGPDEGMMARLDALSDERIIRTGYISGEERLQALAAADLFVLPAVGEGLSMALLEALGAALPVLISPGCNLPEVETYQAGMIVEPQVALLATTLQKMLSKETALQQMGENGRKLIEERFTWDKIAAQLESVYLSYETDYPAYK